MYAEYHPEETLIISALHALKRPGDDWVTEEYVVPDSKDRPGKNARAVLPGVRRLCQTGHMAPRGLNTRIQCILDRSVASSLARRICRSRGPVGLLRLHLPGQLVVLFDVLGLPGVADPLVADGARGEVAAAVDHIGGEGPLLLLVLVLFDSIPHWSALVPHLVYRKPMVPPPAPSINVSVGGCDSREAQRC